VIFIREPFFKPRTGGTGHSRHAAQKRVDVVPSGVHRPRRLLRGSLGGFCGSRRASTPSRGRRQGRRPRRQAQLQVPQPFKGPTPLLLRTGGYPCYTGTCACGPCIDIYTMPLFNSAHPPLDEYKKKKRKKKDEPHAVSPSPSLFLSNPVFKNHTRTHTGCTSTREGMQC
jgi:hypothetical protein